MAVIESVQTGTIQFTAAGDALSDQTRTFNILTIEYATVSGNGGIFTVVDGMGSVVDTAATSAQSPEASHQMHGEEFTGLGMSAMPSASKVLVRYRRRVKV